MSSTWHRKLSKYIAMIFLKYTFNLLLLLILYVWGCTHVRVYTCKSEDNFVIWFPPFIMWVLEIKFKS